MVHVAHTYFVLRNHLRDKGLQPSAMIAKEVDNSDASSNDCSTFIAYYSSCVDDDCSWLLEIGTSHHIVSDLVQFELCALHWF